MARERNYQNLQATLSPGDLQAAARLIRERWPRARILIIREEAWCIEDALYDERVSPGAHPEVLLTAVNGIRSGRDVNSSIPKSTTAMWKSS
jgi:hypothetical protein